ncbi:MAG: hypothetical protein U0R24_11185 [Solirubrobacterales bacterium]
MSNRSFRAGGAFVGVAIVLAVVAATAWGGYAKTGSYSSSSPTGRVDFKVKGKGFELKNFTFSGTGCTQKAKVKTVLFVSGPSFRYSGSADMAEPTDNDNVIIEGKFTSKKKATGTATLNCPSTATDVKVSFAAKLQKGK